MENRSRRRRSATPTSSEAKLREMQGAEQLRGARHVLNTSQFALNIAEK
jgi:hypothetical protein